MLLGLGLPGIESPVEWGFEKRNSADRVVESGHFGFVKFVEQVDVWGLEKELRLGEWKVSGIAANCLSEWHVIGLASD